MARALEQLESDFAVLPVAETARAALGARELPAYAALELSFGRRIATREPAGSADAPVAAFAPDGALVALLADDGARSRPVLVLAPA